MKSTIDNPLAYFDNYLDKAIALEWNNYSNGIIENLFHSPYDELDNINKTLKVYNVETDNYNLYFFERHIEFKINEEIQKSKQFIELGFQKRFSNRNEVKAYAEFLRIKVQTLLNLKAFLDFPFLISKFNGIIKLINNYSKENVINSNNVMSFNLVIKDNENQKDKINTLYRLLIENPPLINSTKSEFLKAFSGKELVKGIYWLVVGKSKMTSKVALFYFIEQLMNNHLLEVKIMNDLNKHVLYTFRDCDGNKFKNLKQSKSISIYSKKTSNKERIDFIISQLQK